MVKNEQQADSEITLNKVIDLWIMSSSTKHKRSTNSTYKTVADRHIRPALGTFTIGEITSVVLTEYIRDKACGSGEERALAPSPPRVY